MSNQAISEVEILKITSHNTDANKVSDFLAVEEPLEIRVTYGPNHDRKSKSISITMRTPGFDFELAAGFLFTEGIVKNKEEISSIAYVNSFLNPENILMVELDPSVMPDILKLERNFYTTSSCGVCGKASIEAVKTTGNLTASQDALRINKDLIYGLPESLQQHQAVFGSTGGLHACALFNMEGNFINSREDVGRHNALDKLIGWSLLQNKMPLNQYLLLLSGRASFELIQKAAMANIKIVAAVGAPSSLAVETAKEFGITLIGFLRDKRFNIYSGEERIAL
jgi:FdhD protein